MADSQEPEVAMEDDYDEEADSDFQGAGSDADGVSSSSEGEATTGDNGAQRPHKRRKVEDAPDSATIELDSGDEATIKEVNHSRRRRKKKADGASAESDNESDEWHARTRAMRMREKEERKRTKLASCKGSTIDVDKLWEEMNRPDPLPPPRVEGEAQGPDPKPPTNDVASTQLMPTLGKEGNKENVPSVDGEETITIKRTYKFAGEVHVEEKTVPKSSAEAQLWLSQQQLSKPTSSAESGSAVSRPLRKISRFDPNFGNLGAFKGSWAAQTHEPGFKGPKLNVVEKSKMDWAAHVDTEGLKEELDTHAKAKEGYLNRMDFLRGVEERREAEARAARLKQR
ncbi:SWR1-complex protein 5 [Exophiala dermatitidis]